MRATAPHASIADVTATAEDIEREKDRLPRGWGRFGKALEQLAGICEPDESLLSTCVTLNPQFRHSSSTLAGGLLEMTDSTNVVLAATSKRLIVISTGMSERPQALRPVLGRHADRRAQEERVHPPHRGRRDPLQGCRQAGGAGLPRRGPGPGQLARHRRGRTRRSGVHTLTVSRSRGRALAMRSVRRRARLPVGSRRGLKMVTSRPRASLALRRPRRSSVASFQERPPGYR